MKCSKKIHSAVPREAFSVKSYLFIIISVPGRKFALIMGIPKREKKQDGDKELSIRSLIILSSNVCVCVCVCLSVCLCGVLPAQLCPIICHPMDCSPPGCSVRGILQARTLEWVAISFSRGASPPRDRTSSGGFFTTAPPGKSGFKWCHLIRYSLSLWVSFCFAISFVSFLFRFHI